jgi:hypothetical protein
MKMQFFSTTIVASLMHLIERINYPSSSTSACCVKVVYRTTLLRNTIVILAFLAYHTAESFKTLNQTQDLLRNDTINFASRQ